MSKIEREPWSWSQHLQFLLEENTHDSEAIMIARLNILIEQNPSRREFYEAIENSLKETAWNVSEEAGGCNKTRCRAAYSWFNENLHYLTIYGMENLCDGYDPNHPWFTED